MDTGGDVRGILDAEGVDTGNAPPALPDALTPQRTESTTQQGQSKLIFGKFKGLSEAEKAYKAAEQKVTATSERQKKLDAILNHPELMKFAATNPEVKKALTEAGYSLAEVEEKEAQEEAAKNGNAPWNGDENAPEYRMALFERKWELKEQKSGIEAELKRPLSNDEWNETKEKMKLINPNMDARLAWRLTDSFLKLLTANQKKELDKARGVRGNPERPPPALLPTGERADLTKRPSKMNAHEKGEFIKGIMRGDIK